MHTHPTTPSPSGVARDQTGGDGDIGAVPRKKEAASSAGLAPEVTPRDMDVASLVRVWASHINERTSQ